MAGAQKLCFVTVGATASFHELIDAALRPDFLAALQNQNYTQLLVQYGVGNKAHFDKALAASKAVSHNVTINSFELDANGLNTYMLEARGTVTTAGVVISHAGSGTILDALRLSVPLIVVPNASLLDNHQIELAEALAEQGYVIHGQLNGLPQALLDAEVLAKRHQEWPPVNSGDHREVKGLRGIFDEEMGFLD
ncbi:hypothetical protein AMS68_005411 [Peltaster fructicola]|uniref:UDP-N-acetylglucosamine transferase subunit ALG13 n=1 Tax=Peltaster fructicola TaxID=286661 RepID=A0A6H0XYR9_9PEZI|nr:hypothetical protein AMS68_005411 [Peltaster fructicola]